MNYKITTVAFGALRKITGSPLHWQYNEQQILVIKGLDLPEFYEVDFCNKGDTETITMTGSAEGVVIPDQFLLDGRPLIAYIVVVDGESVNTVAEITFPVNVRAERTDISPEPAEQQQIDELISLMNQATLESEASASEAERQAGIAEGHAEDAGESAVLAESWAVGGTSTRQGEDNDNAKHYAEVAQQGAEEAGYVWFDVNDETGEMYVTITANLEEDVSFTVNESVGTLEVTYE